MLDSRKRIVVITAALSACLLHVPPAHATVPSDLCVGNPCTVVVNRNITSGSNLDFGSANLVIGNNVTLTILAGTGRRTLTIRAGSITMQPNAKIVGSGALVELITGLGGFTMQSAGTSRSLIDVRGLVGGEITIDSAGDVVIGGRLDASGQGADSEGGFVTIETEGTFSSTERISAGASGVFSFGGEVSITAANGLTVGGMIDTSAGGSDGGFVTLIAEAGNILINREIRTHGGNPDGEGGAIEISAERGSIFTSATVHGRGGAGAEDDCGDGAEISFNAGQNIQIGGKVSSRGGLHCYGGEISVTSGGNFVQLAAGSIHAFGPGAFGGGGGFIAQVAGNATILNVDIGSTGFGGIADILALGTVSIGGLLTAASTAFPDSIGGEINVQACDLTVLPGGDLDTRGNFSFGGFGVTRLKSSGPLRIQGRVRGSMLVPPLNRPTVELRHKAILPVVTGTISPAPLIAPDLTLPDCTALPQCGNGTVDGSDTCDDGNNASCDGCRADCTRADKVCGDGIMECGEQCDDGNTTDGDGCESDCTFPGIPGVRIPGTKRTPAGCLVEWDLKDANPAILDSGFPRSRQDCVDGDPGCDVDGVKDGDCELEVQACARVADPRLPICSAAVGPIQHIEILKPKPGAGSDPYNLANAIAMRDALLGLGGRVKLGTTNLQDGPPIAGFDTCTQRFLAKVPIAPSGQRFDSRVLRIGAVDTNGTEMAYNALKLRCFPNFSVCGNGIVEIESCDDGNTLSCDGCSATCAVEACGNGIQECDEECDEGPANGTAGSLCSATCEEIILAPELRIRGGGARSADCPWQWSLQIDPSAVERDRNGDARTLQRCRDNDPSCDLNPDPNRCRFRVWGCVGEADTATSCAATTVSSVTIKRPPMTSVHPNETAAQKALAAALVELGLPRGPASEKGAFCRPFEVEVPVNRKKIVLKVQASAGKTDTDTLKLFCDR